MRLILIYFNRTVMVSGETAAQIVEALQQQHQAGQRLVAVVTALEGVTDLLRDSVRQGNYGSVYNKLLTIHKNAARRLVRDETARKHLHQDVTDMLDSYQWMGKSASSREPTPAEVAAMLSTGERLAARLVAVGLQNLGVAAAAVNASELIVTDDDYTAASPDIEATRARVGQRLLSLLEQGMLPVVAGGMGATAESRTTILKEQPGEMSAALLADSAGAEAVWLWGLAPDSTTADPRLAAAPEVLSLADYPAAGRFDALYRHLV